MTADREALVAEVAGMLRKAARERLGLNEGEFWPSTIADALANALADLLAAREQQTRAEALREAAEAIDVERASIEPKNHAAFAARLGMSNAARLVRDKADA